MTSKVSSEAAMFNNILLVTRRCCEGAPPEVLIMTRRAPASRFCLAQKFYNRMDGVGVAASSCIFGDRLLTRHD